MSKVNLNGCGLIEKFQFITFLTQIIKQTHLKLQVCCPSFKFLLSNFSWRHYTQNQLVFGKTKKKKRRKKKKKRNLTTKVLVWSLRGVILGGGHGGGGGFLGRGPVCWGGGGRGGGGAGIPATEFSLD